VSFVDAGTVSLHAKLTGAPENAAVGGPPTLVYLHSLGTEMRIWDAVAEQLSHLPQLRLDLRGHGLSEAPTGDYSIAEMAADVWGVLDQLNIGPVVMIGVSVGGQIALRAAFERPAQVMGVVALDTAARIRNRESWSERIDLVRTRGLEPIADETVARWFVTGVAKHNAVVVAGYRRMLMRTPLEGYLGTCAALRDEDLTPHLARITQPVLVVCGSHDAATPPAVVRGLAQGLPHARYVEIAAAGHLPCLDQPSATAAHIDSFVRELASR
jgi:3-oxoadipate enol-lactonase